MKNSNCYLNKVQTLQRLKTKIARNENNVQNSSRWFNKTCCEETDDGASEYVGSTFNNEQQVNILNMYVRFRRVCKTIYAGYLLLYLH